MATPTTTVLPPGPKAIFPSISVLAFRRDPIKFLTHLTERYGDLVYFEFVPQPMFLVNNPDYIRDVFVTHNRKFMKGEGLQRAKRLLGEGLLTSEGEFHLRQRRLAQPAFHRQRIAGYAATMVEYADRACDRWLAGETRDVAREMMRLTLAIAGKTLFDANVEGEADEIGKALTTTFELFNTLTLPFRQLLERLPLPASKRFLKARERLDATIYRIINERRASGEDRGDLLSMLIAARDEEGDGSGMTDEQLRDEAMTIFLAGHETTANALTWTWYLLSQPPEAEATLHAELDRVLAGRLPTVATVIMSAYVTQRDPRYYPEPERFDPARWTPEARAARPRFAYFPFGGGARQCIGEPFAWMEGVLILATIAQGWRLRLLPGHRVEPQALITLRPRYGMRMVAERRRS